MITATQSLPAIYPAGEHHTLVPTVTADVATSTAAANDNSVEARRASLDQKLSDTRASAQTAYSAYDNSRQMLYNLFANIYLLSREFMADIPYLEELYRRNNIGGGALLNDGTLNYRCFIRLVFAWDSVDGYKNNKLTDWSRVLSTLHRNYEERPNQFKAAAPRKLADIIVNLGGITNISRPQLAVPANDNIKDGDDDGDGDGGSTPPNSTPKNNRNGDEFIDYCAVVAENDDGVGLGVFKPLHGGLSNDPEDSKNNLIALIGVVTSEGTVRVLGYSQQPHAQSAVAKDVVSDNAYVHQAGQLRQIGEMIQVLSYPSEGRPKEVTKWNTWRTKVLQDAIPKSSRSKKFHHPLTGPRSMVINGTTGEVEYSAPRVSRTVLLRCKPATTLSTIGTDLVLSAADCAALDDALQAGTYGVLKHSAPVVPEEDGMTAAAVLPVTRVPGSSADICFTSAPPVGLPKQSLFDEANFTPTWEHNVSVLDLADFRREFLTNWLRTLGRDTQMKRQNNRVMRFTVNASGIVVDFNIHGNGPCPSRSLRGSMTIVSTTATTFYVRSKDVVPVLYHLPRLAKDGTIAIGGDNHHMVVRFTSKVGAYTVVIPI